MAVATPRPGRPDEAAGGKVPWRQGSPSEKCRGTPPHAAGTHTAFPLGRPSTTLPLPTLLLTPALRRRHQRVCQRVASVALCRCCQGEHLVAAAARLRVNRRQLQPALCTSIGGQQGGLTGVRLSARCKRGACCSTTARAHAIPAYPSLVLPPPLPLPVSVPVLSSTTVSTSASPSITSPPRSSRPRRAPVRQGGGGGRRDAKRWARGRGMGSRAEQGEEAGTARWHHDSQQPHTRPARSAALVAPRTGPTLLLPADEATSTAVGVASPSAQGQATTSTSMASLRASSSGAAAPPASTASVGREWRDAPGRQRRLEGTPAAGCAAAVRVPTAPCPSALPGSHRTPKLCRWLAHPVPEGRGPPQQGSRSQRWWRRRP